MIEQIFSKFIWPFALILGLVSNPAYIQLGSESLTFDYKTGDLRPLYFLSVKNIGGQKARFDISANTPWIFISREGYDNVTSIYLEREGVINFVLDIRTEMVDNGRHSAQLTVKAISASDYSETVFDTKTIPVVLNKNYTPPAVSPVASPSVSPSVSPSATATPPTISPTPSASPSPSIKPSPAGLKPILSPSVSPSKAPAQPLPSPAITPAKTLVPSIAPVSEKQAAPKGIWKFFRNLFFKIF